MKLYLFCLFVGLFYSLSVFSQELDENVTMKINHKEFIDVELINEETVSLSIESFAFENNERDNVVLRSSNIYQENFETSFSDGLLGTTPVNGWSSSVMPSSCGENYWGVYVSGLWSINNRCLKVTGVDGDCNIYPGQYLIGFQTDRYAYVTIDAGGYESLSLAFDWISNGEIYNGVYYDYGTIVYRQGTSGSWQTITSGGNDGLGKYAGQTACQSENLSLPASLNDGVFQIGFRWQCDNSYGTNGGFVIDNIVVSGNTLGAPPLCTNPVMPANGSVGQVSGDPLSWSPASGATSYDLYFGTSNNPPFVANVSATTYTPTLSDNTTYYWKVIPKNAFGEPSGCEIWEFTSGTGPQAGDYRSRFTGSVNYMWDVAENWQVFNGSTWVVAGNYPNNEFSDVLIQSDSKMIVNQSVQVENLRVEGLLQYYWGDGTSNNTAKTLIVNGDLTLLGDADFQTNAASDANRNFVHLLIAKGNIYNNANAGHGMLLNDYPQSGVWSYVQVRFRGSGNVEWSGNGENDLGGLSILKENAFDVVTLKPSQLKGWGSTDLDGNGFFMYDVIDHIGILKIAGTFPMTTRFGIQSTNSSADDERILPFISSEGSGNDFTLIIDNPNFGISGYSPVKCYGNLKLLQGTMNVGDNMADNIEFMDGASLFVAGGDLSCTGALLFKGTGSFDFNLSEGRIRTGYFGNSLSDQMGWFDIRNNASVTISGGEIHLINTQYTTNLAYPMYNVSASSVNITGGKLLVGSAVSPVGNNTFSISGKSPSIELYTNGSDIFSNAIMWNDVICFGGVDIPEGCAFSIYNQDAGDVPYTLSLTGDLNNNGTIYAEVENSKVLFDGSSSQLFHSVGAYSDGLGTEGISVVEVDNAAGVVLAGNGISVTKALVNSSGTLDIGDCFLNVYGNVIRTNGFLGGNSNSELFIHGSGDCGNLFFDPNRNTLKTLSLNRTIDGSVWLVGNLKIASAIDFSHGILYSYENGDFNLQSDTVFLASDALLLNENSDSYLYGTVSIRNNVSLQTELLQTETFDSDILVHGSTAPSTVWFAPDSNIPISHVVSGGCAGGQVSYSGNWNNHWGNFLRLPEVDCSPYNQITLSFDVSHSYFPSQTNDWCRFYMWADGAYKHNVISVKINGVDVTYDSGANGKGFQYLESRSCANVDVTFDISEIANKTDILLYLEASCGYNNSNEFYTGFDNVSVSGVAAGAGTHDFGNVWAVMENVSEELGDVRVTRVTGVDGQQLISDATSIDCYWDIDVENQPLGSVDLEFKWLEVFDNGLSTAHMNVFSLHDPNPWESVGNPVGVSGNPRTIGSHANNFSKWTVAVKNQVLPVELSSFDVNCCSGNHVISWVTETEKNTDYFIIQASKDGRLYSDLARVEAVGNSYLRHFYEYIVHDINDNKFYRLKEIDVDGSEVLFESVMVNCADLIENFLSIYPNPFDGQVLSVMSAKVFDNALVEVIDSQGKIVERQKVNLCLGHSNIQFENIHASGLYILNIYNEKGVSFRFPLMVE